MYIFLNSFIFLAAVMVPFSPIASQPLSESDSIFYPDLDSAKSLSFDQASTTDGFDMDPVPLTDALALAPSFTNSLDVPSQPPTDMMEANMFDPGSPASLDPPLLLSAIDDWDWECPKGKYSYCCDERDIEVDQHVFGQCRNRRFQFFWSAFSTCGSLGFCLDLR